MSVPAMHSVSNSEPAQEYGLVKNSEPEISFRTFDAGACQFDPPKVSILPRLTRASFSLTENKHFAPVTAGTQYRFYSRGRYALQEAYRLAGVGPQGAILIPAYHCRTMIDPAIRRRGQVLLYSLDQKLVPDISSVIRLTESSKTPIVALLLTHYFGFPQVSGELLAFCNERGITIIEDCSHAYFRHRNDRVLGKIGRYVVASPYKFCPSEDGGVLIENAEASTLHRALGARGFADQLRSVVRVIGKSRQDGRHLTVTVNQENIPKSRTGDLAQGNDQIQPGNHVSRFYESEIENKAGLLFSRLIIKGSHADQIAERRRANFQRWLQAVQGLPRCRPLFDALPDNVVPYMFPLYIERPDLHFSLFKKLGLPIYRWDEQAVSNCAVSADYRLHLLHLPCHQSLEPAEIDWMVNVLSKVMEEGVS